MIRPAPLSMLLVLWLGLTACGTPTLRGTVVSGSAASVEWVRPSDPRLEADGVASARVAVYLNPDRFNPERIGLADADGRGRFAVPLDTPGAGVLELDVELRAVREPDHGLAAGRLSLPRRNRELLVTLPAGGGGTLAPEAGVLQKTLDDAEPYLRE